MLVFQVPSAAGEAAISCDFDDQSLNLNLKKLHTIIEEVGRTTRELLDRINLAERSHLDINHSDIPDVSWSPEISICAMEYLSSLRSSMER